MTVLRGLACRWGQKGFPAVVKEATEFIYNKESCSELKRAFREDWVRRHLTHMHSDAPELPFPKGKVAGQGPDHDCSPCWVAGKCICSIAGANLQLRIAA